MAEGGGDGRGLSVNTYDCNERHETVGTSGFKWRIMQPRLKNHPDRCIRWTAESNRRYGIHGSNWITRMGIKLMSHRIRIIDRM